MPSTISQVMTAIKTRLATITGLQAYDYASDKPEPPCAFPMVPPIRSYRSTMGRGLYEIEIPVVLLVSAILDRDGQHKLASYASATGSSSIILAIEGDKTLGGTVSDSYVTGFDPNGLEEVNMLNFYGGTFGVHVVLPGDVG